MDTLTAEYQALVNNRLPAAAQSGQYPVRFNHCFARIILDNVCDRRWDEVINRPAYKNMTPDQLRRAIALGQEYLSDPAACYQANQKSLQYRGKLHA